MIRSALILLAVAMTGCNHSETTAVQAIPTLIVYMDMPREEFRAANAWAGLPPKGAAVGIQQRHDLQIATPSGPGYVAIRGIGGGPGNGTIVGFSEILDPDRGSGPRLSSVYFYPGRDPVTVRNRTLRHAYDECMDAVRSFDSAGWSAVDFDTRLLDGRVVRSRILDYSLLESSLKGDAAAEGLQVAQRLHGIMSLQCGVSRSEAAARELGHFGNAKILGNDPSSPMYFAWCNLGLTNAEFKKRLDEF